MNFGIGEVETSEFMWETWTLEQAKDLSNHVRDMNGWGGDQGAHVRDMNSGIAKPET